MMFDIGSLAYLRNPWGDESLVDIVRAATVCDEEGRLESLMRSVEMPEMKVDLLSPADDLFVHIRRYNPNLLIMPAELLGEDFFAELTLMLTKEPVELPFLVVIGKESVLKAQELTERYKYCLHIEWINAEVCGEILRRFVTHEILTLNELTSRLRQCAAVTLKAMRIKTEDALNFLIDETTEVLDNSFVFFDSINELHDITAKRLKVDSSVIIDTIDSATEQAIKSMTIEEFNDCFSWYIEHKRQPGTAEFIFTAARITSYYCSRLIRHIDILKTGQNTLPREK